MSDKRDKKDDRYVVHTISEVAQFLGISEPYLNQWWPRGCPRTANGRRWKYDLRAIVAWAVENVWKRPAPKPGPNDDPEMFGEFDSPALERYRTARAEQVELQLAEAKKELIPRDIVHDCQMRMAQIIRQAGELLQKDFGPEAQTILDDALDDCERLIHEHYGDPEPDE